MKRFLRHTGRILLFLIFSVLILVLGISLAIRVPAVQSWLVKNSTGILERELGLKVELAEVQMALPIKAELKELQIYDTRTQPLLTAASLNIDLLSFSLWDIVFNTDQLQTLSLQSIDLDQPTLFLYKSKVDSALNLQQVIDRIAGTEEKVPDSSLFMLDFPSIHIRQGRLSYIDSTAADLDIHRTSTINFHHLSLENIEADASLSLLLNRTLDIHLGKMSFTELYSGFEIKDLQTELFTTLHAALIGETPSLELSNLSLKTGQTHLLADIRFPERELSQIFDFEDRVQLGAILKRGSKIDFQSLEYLTQDTLPLKGVLSAEGNISGNWQELQSQGLTLSYGAQTKLLARFQIKEYLTPDQTRLKVHLDRSQISFQELQDFLPSVPFPDLLTRLDLLNLLGQFSGSYDDFRVKTSLDSEFGKLVADLDLQLPPAVPILTYKGSFRTNQLNVDSLRLSEEQISNRLTASGWIDGQGASIEDLDAKINVLISQSEIKGTMLDSLRAVVEVGEKKMIGKIEGADLEGYANLDVNIDLDVSPAIMKAEGQIKNLNLARYIQSPQDLWVTSLLDIDISGDSLDQLNGELRLKDVVLRKNDGEGEGEDEFMIPEFWFQAFSSPDYTKYYNLKSSLVHVDLSGQFQLTDIGRLTQQFFYENQLYFTNQDSLMSVYYQDKDTLFSDSHYQIAVSVQDSLNHALAFFDVPAQFATESLFIGGFQFGSEDQVNFSFSSDSARYGVVGMEQGQVDLHLIKPARERYPFVAGGIQSSRLTIGPRFELDQLFFNLQGSENVFETDLEAAQNRSFSDIQLKLHTLFGNDGSIRSTVDPSVSEFRIRQDTLRFDQGDSLIFQNGELLVQNLLLENDNQYFRLDGLVSEKEDSELSLIISELSLGILSELFPLTFDIAGNFNADIVGRNLLGKPRFSLRSRIDDFTLNDSTFGDVLVESDWQEEQEQVDLNAQLVKNTNTILTLEGYYSLVDSLSPIFMSLSTEEEGGFPLDYVVPFVKDQLYDVKGNVRLKEFVIKGPPDDLLLSGVGQFEKAQFGISYFKTVYRFDGEVEFNNTAIRFPGIRLYDTNDNFADLHGWIYHKGLRDFTFDLQLDSVRNFLVMNTQKKDNETFYGTLYLRDGLADITGDLERISVQAIASTGKNSSLKIPVSDYSDNGRPDYIYFLGAKEEENKPVKTDLQGFELDLTILATEDAEVELIFDERVGDVIKGRGKGSINLYINESGDFTMFGDYEINQGDYLFTSQNVINKKFKVKEGGKISWSGDPFDANLDLQAVYPVRADLKYLLQSSNSIRTDVNVLMHMKGLLSKPEIGLSIELPNIRSADADRALGYLRNIKFDEQELNKQVFSLMVFNRFAPIGGDLGGNLASLGVTTSISEMLSNQLNLLLSQVTGDKVEVNVNTSDFQDVNLLVSARLFNDRVTLERDGTLVQANSDESSQFSIGNIRIIIRLLPSANPTIPTSDTSSEMVLEVFTRENFRANAQGGSFTQNQTGLGIFFKKDFDHLSSLLKRKKK